MRQRLTGMVLPALVLAACGSTTGPAPAVQVRVAAGGPNTATMVTPPTTPPTTLSPTASVASHRATRTIDKDPDGDGIANCRIIITEVFDKSGMLLERIREDDFEADGIVDARNVTTFGD